MIYIFMGLFLATIFTFVINQWRITSILENKYPELHYEIFKGKLNGHTPEFSKFLYKIKSEKDPQLKKLKILNICMLISFPTVFITFMIVSIVND